MRAAQVTAIGGPEVLRVANLPDPTPGPGEVLVRVEAAGVGPWDTKMRAGNFGKRRTPYIPGGELAGTVTAVGAGVDGFTVGDAVWAFPGITGATAELVVVPVAAVGRRPTTLSAVDAAGAPVGVLTADEALDLLELGAGQTLLVLAAGGNVGSFAVQLARHRGATVIAQASAVDADRLRERGAAVVVDYHGDWPAAVRRAAPGGVDALLDPLAGEARVAALALVRDGGRAVTLLPESLPEAPRGVTLTGMSVKPDGRRLTRLAELFDQGVLHTQTGPTFALDQIADAHRAYEQGAKGKVVVRMA
ncbi:MAG: NADP-dependent oxidoreductase [Gemmatimonadaceae bacterium]